MSENQTLTAHGEVEYETVTCSSCGDEVLKKEASCFFIGSLYKPHRSIHGENQRMGGYTEICMYNGYDKGWACEYCRDGPIQYPQSDSFWKRLKWVMWGDT